MAIVFRRTRQLEAQFDNFLDRVLTGGLLFRQGVEHYLQHRFEECRHSIEQLDKVEGEADTLRRDIEASLYTETLIPESRGDVLGLLEATDGVLNRAEELLDRFAAEHPEIPVELHEKLIALAASSANAMEALVGALRAYFRDPAAVRDHITKVLFYEQEADDTGKAIVKTLFDSDIELARKLHIRFFVEQMLSVSDRAEDVTDRLSIAVIKRYD
ncbi:MAG: DUF47 family protein [Deltaproteobacteria bacterium]|nr:DUF47 family protein [Deltaproteobacteria bacterium]